MEGIGSKEFGCGEVEFGKGSSVAAFGDFLEDFTLAFHIGCLKAGAGGHVFPDDARGFESERITDVDGILGFDDESERAERS